MVQMHAVSVEQGVSWIGSGWRIFMRRPASWIVFGLVLILFLALSLSSFVGDLIVSLILPALLGGQLFAAQEAEQGRALEFGYLLRGFREPRTRNGLLTLGTVAVAGGVASELIMRMFIDGATMDAMMSDPTAASAAVLGAGGIIGVLLVLTVQVLLAMALLYAVPLVMFRGVSVGAALQSSIGACTRNFLPLLVFSAVYVLLSVIASLPLLLGWLVLVPASVGMQYASYRDIFGS